MTQENANLPEPVRRQLDLANKLAEEQLGGEGQPGVVVAPVVEATPITPTVAAVTEETPPAATTPAVEPPAKVIEPAVVPAEDDYKAQYLTLKGKYDTEVPALRAEIAATNRQVDSLLTLLETQGDKGKAAPATPPTPAATTSFVTPEDKEQFGEDMVAMVNRAAKQMLVDLGIHPDKLQGLVAEFGKVKETTTAIASHIQQSDEEKMHAYLQGVLPEYTAVDADPEFGEWLAKPDLITGVPLAGVYETVAMRSFDGPRVEAIMRRFAAETGKRFRSSEQPPVVEQKKVDPREALTTPTRNTANQPPAPAKKSWTVAEVTQFYRDVREKRYSVEKAAQIEADIFEAQREGRVV